MIVTNTMYQLAPWADALFAIDLKWWEVYGKDAKRKFKGERLSVSASARMHGAKRVYDGMKPMNSFGNSGAGAIALAVLRGASRIYLLGYDGRYINGKKHCHGDHPKPLGNAGSVIDWPAQFDGLSQYIGDRIPVINCSPNSAIRSFRRASVEDVL